jgi:hypothetical protein
MLAKITYPSRLSKQFRRFLGRFSFYGIIIGEAGRLPQLALGF